IRTMTAKILRIEQHKADALKDSSGPEAAHPEAAGWDPYEVWRTRVLLPRMRDDDSGTTTEPSGSKGPSSRRPKRL
ncbi:MAG: hypothetical protein JXB36_01350, partial [Gammaproteobacteria bacterium]|nr:hypothetical protein [Gammaproteobacteria bacterium]